MHGRGDLGLGRPRAQLSRSRTFLCLVPTSVMLCFPGGSDGKESACNAGKPAEQGEKTVAVIQVEVQCPEP